MPPIRRNDSQTERLLEALKDTSYRQTLARKAAGIKSDKLPAEGTDERRIYENEMRRLQRYVTEGKQKRSFARSPLPYRRELRAAARAVPPPIVKARLAPPPAIPPEKLPPSRIPIYGDISPREIPPEHRPVKPHRERKKVRRFSLYDIQAALAYHDGDAHEFSRELGTGRIGESLLELAQQSVQIDSEGHYTRLESALRDWFESLDAGDAQDIDDFAALLHDLPDWEISMILDDIAEGETTFADWIDAWKKDGMTLFDSSNAAFWQLWRSTYSRATA